MSHATSAILLLMSMHMLHCCIGLMERHARSHMPAHATLQPSRLEGLAVVDQNGKLVACAQFCLMTELHVRLADSRGYR